MGLAAALASAQTAPPSTGPSVQPTTLPPADPESATRYAGLTDSEAWTLAQGVLPKPLPLPLEAAAPTLGASSTARSAAGTAGAGPKPKPKPKAPAKVEYLDDRTARVTAAGAKAPRLLSSTFPLRTRDAKGQPRPIDLRLRRSGRYFVPANAGTAVKLARDLGSSSVLGDAGLRVRAVGRGRTATARQASTAFYANASKSTDVSLSAEPGGLQAMWVLRAASSPETAQLELAAKTLKLRRRPSGEVVVRGKGGKRIALVRAPLAWDARGARVEVRTSVKGNRIRYRVAHRGRELQYPIVLDPVVVAESWAAANDPRGWQSSTPSPGHATSVGAGLHLDYTDVLNQAAGAAEWRYKAPNAGAITYFAPGGVAKSSTPSAASCVEMGLRTAGGTSIATTGQHCGEHVSAGYELESPVTNQGNVAYFRNVPAANATEAHASLFSAEVWLDDDQAPTFGTFTYSHPPTQWVNTETVWIKPTANDAGLGIHRIDVVDMAHLPSRVEVPNGQCNGTAASPCTTSFSPQIDPAPPAFPTVLNGAGQDFIVSASDPLGKSVEQTVSFKVDREKPELTLAGTLGEGAILKGDDVALAAAALDGNPNLGNNPSDVYRKRRRAGVASIRVKLDGATQQPDSTQTCEHSCALDRSFPVDPDGLSHGNHALEVIATDQAGNARSATRTFVVDKRGPDIGLTGSLMDARGSTLTKESYHLDITAQDGVHGSTPESGARRIEVLWQDQGSSTWRSLDDIDRACATDSCSLEHQFTFEPRRYAGAGRLMVKAYDALDNMQQEVIELTPGANAGFETTALSGLEEYLEYDSVDTGAGGRAHVNQTTGNLVWNLLPLVNPGRGLSTFANVTYNSQTRPASSSFTPYDELGPGFSLGLSTITRVNEPLDLTEVDAPVDPRITLVDPDGTRHVFKEHASGEYYVPPAGFNVHLRRYSSAYDRTWAATRPDGATYFFDQRGFATSIEDRNTNVLRYAYEIVPLDSGASCPAWGVTTAAFSSEDCRQRLVAVTDAAGVRDGAPNRSVTVAYEPGADGHIASLTDHAGRVLRFTYSGGRLTAVTQADGTDQERKHRLLYGGDGLGAVQDPRGAETRFRYGYGYLEKLDGAAHDPDERSETRVERVTQRDGRHRDHTYLDGPDGADDLVWETRASNARGEVTRTFTDHRGRTKKLTDPRGTDTILRWDGDNNVTHVREATGTSDAAQTEMGYNAHGQLEWITNPADERTDLHYAIGQGVHVRPGGETLDGFVSDLNQIETPKGDATGIAGDFAELYELDARGNVTGRRDGEGSWSRTAFDSYGQVVKETDAIGNVTRYERYDPSGLARVMIDPKQGRWEYAYDAVGNLVATSDPRSAEHGGVSDPAHRFKVRFTYDALDQMVREVMPKDSRAGEFITREYDHDANGNAERSVDGTGAATTQVFDEMDRPTALRTPPVAHADEESPASETTRVEYDGEGLVTRETRPRGEENAGSALDFSTDYEYDANGQLVVERRHQLEPGGAVTSLITSRAYDRRGNLVGLTDPERNAASSLSPTEAVASATHRRWTYKYDLADRRVREVEDPSGEALETAYEYDRNENLVKTVSPRGFAATRSYDGRDMLVSQTNAAGEATQYRRRADGLVDEIRHPRYFTAWDPNEFVERFVYDPAGLVVEHRLPRTDTASEPETPPTWRYQRDAVGDATRVTDPRGDAYQSTFLDSGDVRSTTRPSAWRVAGSDVVAKEWNELGNDASSGGLPASEGHGDFGAVGSAGMPGLLPKAGRTQFGYDAELRLTSVTEVLDPTNAADDVTARIERDALGRVSKLVRPRDTAAGQVITQLTAYDRNGNRTTDTDGTGATTRYAYDQFDRLVEQAAPPGSRGVPDVTRYAYTPNSRVAAVTTPRGTTTSSCYDRVDRLESVTDPLGAFTSYDYDKDGNRTFEGGPRAFNADSQPASCANWPGASSTPNAQVTERTFDEVGRVVTQTQGGPGARLWQYEYDADGNTTRVQAPGANTDPGTGAEQRRDTRYAYNGRGLLYSTRTFGTDDGANVLPGDDARITVTERDGIGNLRRVVNPEGVDPGTGIPKTADQAPARTSVAADADRSNPAVAAAAKRATVYEYSADNLLTAIHLPVDGTDADRQYRQSFHLDGRGRTTEVDAPNEWTKAPALCERGRLDQSFEDVTKTACVQRTTLTYFDTGWIRQSVEPAGARKNSQNPADIEEVGGETHAYDYDARGLQTSWTVTNGNGVVRRTSTRKYWPNGQLEHRIADRPGDVEPADKAREYDYRWSANGQLVAVVDRGLEISPTLPGDDRVYRLAYDAADRLIATDEADQPDRPGVDTAMRRDIAGNVTDRWHNGKLTGASVSAAGTLDFAQGSSGQLDDTTFQSGTRSQFEYDVFDQETKATITPPAQSDARQVLDTAYWLSGERRSRKESTFTAAAPNIVSERVTEANGWSRDGRPWRTTRTRPGAAPDKAQDYRYDLDGNRTADETGSYVVNARGQLARWTRQGGASSVAYLINGAGDVLRETDTAGTGLTTDFRLALGRLMESIATPGGGAQEEPLTLRYGYDVATANVETIGASDSQGGGTEDVLARFTYDPFDRVDTQEHKRTVPGEAEDEVQTDAERFTYDAFDRRDLQTKTTNKGPDEVVKEADLGYIGIGESLSRRDPVGDDDADKGSTWDYDSSMEAVGQARADGQGDRDSYRTLAKDVNGSVEALLGDDGSAAADERYRYDPYGNAVDDTQRKPGGGPANDQLEASLSDVARDNPIRFQGFYFDSGVRTYDMRARSYLPSAGRFLTQDRFESSTGDFNLMSDPLTQNRYAFAGGNPVSNVEFDGHEPATSADRNAVQKIRNKKKNGKKGACLRGCTENEPDPAESNDGPDPYYQPKAEKENVQDSVSGAGSYDDDKGRSSATRNPRRYACQACDSPAAAKRRKAQVAKNRERTLGAVKDWTVGDPTSNPLDAVALLPPAKVVRAGAKGVSAGAKAVKGGGSAKRSPSSACRRSFVAGTPVLLADRTTVPIERIRVGDSVLATDQATGETAAFPVTQLLGSAGTKALVRLTIDGTETVATAIHPYWDAGRERWVEARDLRAGDLVARADGSPTRVEAVARFSSAGTRVYNFTVATAHTYYAGASPVLVHNADDCDLPEVHYESGRHPESAEHASDGMRAGQSSIGTIDRPGAKRRRQEAMRGHPTKPGKDRDEFPPAIFEEGGAGASVRHIDPSDNRGSGSSLGHQCRDFPDGTRVRIVCR